MLHLDYRDIRPIYAQITDGICNQISAGVLQKGDKLPSVRELAAEAGVNPNTMQRAITQLETLGLVTTNRTLGRTVTENAEALEEMRRRLGVECAESYFKEMGALGYSRGEAADMAQAERDRNDE